MTGVRAREIVLRLLRHPRGLQSDVISHAIGRTRPEVPCLVVPDLQPTERDRAIAERLLRAYSLAANVEAIDGHRRRDVWSKIREQQAGFVTLLERGEPATLAAYLCNMSRHDATRGTVQGDVEYARICTGSEYRDFIALMIKDKLVSLGEALGVVSCENPEQGVWGGSLHTDIDTLVDAIEKRMGVVISPPAIDGGLLKIRSARALFHDRDLHGLFTAWSLRQMIDCQSSVCEIGGGSGRLAYWSVQLGVKSYTIVDLPLTNVIQAYYLLKALPAAEIRLFGEREAASGQTQVTILPDFCVKDIEPASFDIVVNQDSFPEIHRQTVLDYLVWIKSASRNFFYSINHESKPRGHGADLQQNVPELVEELGGYRRISRTPYWLRRGYVAELYKVAQPD
jgi:hypothetical protein